MWEVPSWLGPITIERIPLLTSRSDSDESDSEDEERKKKPIPKWARGQALASALASQIAVDPDEIFKLHQKTCPLNEVFSHPTGDSHLGLLQLTLTTRNSMLKLYS